MTTRVPSALWTGLANTLVDGLVDSLDAGAAPGTIKIYTGAQPASAGSAPTGTLLGTLTLSDPAFGAAAAGEADASAITGDTSADASGTAGWFRSADSDGNTVIDGSVSEAGGGGDLILDSTAIVAGGAINITSWTVVLPAPA